MNKLKTRAAALLLGPLFAVSAFAAQPQPMKDTELLKGVDAVYSLDNGGLLVDVASRGIEGDVKLKVTVDSEGRVAFIEVAAHNETPGIGGRALSEDYLKSYYGADSTDGVDALAGATVTSGAIKNCVDLALMQYKSIHGIEFELPQTIEEKIEGALTEMLGENFEPVELEELPENITAVYRSEKGKAMVLERCGHNTEEPIKLLVVFNEKDKIDSILVLDHAETEGIGTNALKDTYLWYYLGGNDFALIDMGMSIKIDVVSGATETSISVFKMINAACRLLPELK